MLCINHLLFLFHVAMQKRKEDQSITYSKKKNSFIEEKQMFIRRMKVMVPLMPLFIAIIVIQW